MVFIVLKLDTMRKKKEEHQRLGPLFVHACSGTAHGWSLDWFIVHRMMQNATYPAHEFPVNKSMGFWSK